MSDAAPLSEFICPNANGFSWLHSDYIASFRADSKKCLIRLFNKSYGESKPTDFMKQETEMVAELKNNPELSQLFISTIESSFDPQRRLKNFPTTLHDCAGFFVMEYSAVENLKEALGRIKKLESPKRQIVQKVKLESRIQYLIDRCRFFKLSFAKQLDLEDILLAEDGSCKIIDMTLVLGAFGSNSEMTLESTSEDLNLTAQRLHQLVEQELVNNQINNNLIESKLPRIKKQINKSQPSELSVATTQRNKRVSKKKTAKLPGAKRLLKILERPSSGNL